MAASYERMYSYYICMFSARECWNILLPEGEGLTGFEVLYKVHRMLKRILVLMALTATTLHAELIEKTTKVGSTTVHYKVVLPNGYDPAKTYPAILAFGGGPQNMSTVDSILNRNFRAEAEKRGYIVVAPAAPSDQLFFEDGARIFPEFLKLIQADYKIQDNKFHIAG